MGACACTSHVYAGVCACLRACVWLYIHTCVCGYINKDEELALNKHNYQSFLQGTLQSLEQSQL